MDIKMIVSDLDGTLFNSDKEEYEVSKELIEKIHKFEESGGIFTIATGRPVETSIEVAKTIGIKSPYIAYNGAKIVDVTGKELYSEKFNLKIFKEFLNDVQKNGVSVIFYNNGETICLKHTSRILIYEKKEKTTCIELKEDITHSELQINKILLIGDVSRITELWNRLDESVREEFRYVISEDDYFEIIKNNVSKGNALKRLKEYLDIEDNQVVTIGNHMNDKELIEEAHFGYAVANAVDGLKDIADYVTKGEYESGVIEVIETYLKEEI